MTALRDVRFQFRNATKAEFEAVNRVLLAGEPAYEIDTEEYKIGDGVHPYTMLPYYTNKAKILEYINDAVADVSIVGQGSVGPVGPMGPTGPQGPVGPQGPSGSFETGSGVELLFTFVSPSTTWLINHGLDTYSLVVETFDANGTLFDSEIHYVDSNSIEVRWYYPSSGYARVFN